MKFRAVLAAGAVFLSAALAQTLFFDLLSVLAPNMGV
jgi:hypothetical protein